MMEQTYCESIGLKVGDKIRVLREGREFYAGDVITLSRDDRSHYPAFSGRSKDGDRWNYFDLTGHTGWERVTDTATARKTAHELQDEEVGIPAPLDDVIDTSSERVEIAGENKHVDGEFPYLDCDAPIGDRVAAAIISEMMKDAPSESIELDISRAAGRIAWERVFGLADISAACKKEGITLTFNENRHMPPSTAQGFLEAALTTLNQRGKDYDKPAGERSAASVAKAFNAITGRNVTEQEVWLILQLVKDVRQWQQPDRYHADSALDSVAYAALKAEALASKQ